MVALPNIVMLLPRYKHIGPGTMGRAPTPALLLGAGRLRRRVGKPVKVGENACDQLLLSEEHGFDFPNESANRPARIFSRARSWNACVYLSNRRSKSRLSASPPT